jgi:transitional endoplasmic reticulum ATPase
MDRKNAKKATLKVAEAHARDVGRGIARVDPKIMSELDLVSGDIIEIVGKKKTVALCWPGYPEDYGKGVIRIDGYLRSNAEVSIDGTVTISKLEAKKATKVTLAPTEPLRIIGVEEYLANLLNGRVIARGETIPINIMGRKIDLVVTSTQPAADAVIVTEETQIAVSEQVQPPRAIPRVTYEDIGGLKDAIQKVREMIELPMRHPEVFERLGIEPPKGVLLHGPPGCGKTLLAKALANEVNAHFISLSGPEIMSKFYGESEARLREIFKEAEENAPSIVFIDEIDAIAPVRGGGYGDSHVTERVISQLLTELDGIEELRNVVVIAATNRPDMVDPALLRPGRFDRVVHVPLPDRDARREILKIHFKGKPLAEDVDLDTVASETEGYSGADLAAIASTATMIAIQEFLERYRSPEEAKQHLEELRVSMRHVREAMRKVKPASKAELKIYEAFAKRYGEYGGLASPLIPQSV